MPRDNEMLENMWDEAYSGPVSFMRFKFSQNLETLKTNWKITSFYMSSSGENQVDGLPRTCHKEHHPQNYAGDFPGKINFPKHFFSILIYFLFSLPKSVLYIFLSIS